MNTIYKLFNMDPEKREDIITATSGLGIMVNLLVASIKVIVGLLFNSIAIVSEGVNNAADVMTSVLTLLGTKLAGKHPDDNHPFGYGRIEYITGLVIGAMIVVTGIEMLKSAVGLIIHPTELSVSALSISVVAISAIIKFLLGVYTIKMGKKASSTALEAVGLDCRNDSFVSIVTIASAVIFLVSGVSIDAYAGAFISLLILKAGIDVIKDTIGELIGRPGEKDLATELYNDIRHTKGILNAADMMLHNYGPDRWSGSVNVEMDHEMTVSEAYQILHDLQLKIMHEKDVTMVFGIYAVDNDHEDSRQIRKQIGAFVAGHEYVRSFHAVYVEPDTHKIYVDLTVDYELRDWGSLREEFTAYMKELHPDQELELVIETDFV